MNHQSNVKNFLYLLFKICFSEVEKKQAICQVIFQGPGNKYIKKGVSGFPIGFNLSVSMAQKSQNLVRHFTKEPTSFLPNLVNISVVLNYLLCIVTYQSYVVFNVLNMIRLF